MKRESRVVLWTVAFAVVILCAAIGAFGIWNFAYSPRPNPDAALPRLGAGDSQVAGLWASFGLWGEDNLAIVVWTDVPTSRAGSGAERGTATYSGLHHAADGRRVEWECETSDGRSGNVNINGGTYDLAAGALFLVTMDGGQTQVTQLPLDNRAAKDLSKTLEDLAKTSQEVARFVAAGQKRNENR